jgi:uncharacterized protein (DUF433 family)
MEGEAMTQTDGSTTTEAKQSVVADETAAADDGAIFAGTDVPVAKLFECLEESHNLNIFLHLFPSVTREQALAAMEEQTCADAARIVHSCGDIMSGWPVFKGSRVVIKNLFDYLAKGYSLDVFLYEFPSVSREQAVAALHTARRIIEKDAYEATAG